MHKTLITFLQAVPPLEIMSAAQIVGGIPGRGKAVASFRKRVQRDLEQASIGFPPLGDQLKGKGPLAYFSFRWMAATLWKQPPMLFEPCTMEVAAMIDTFPDLAEKLALLDNVTVSAEDLHEFLTAIRVWTVTPKRKSHKKTKRHMTRRYDSSPAWDGYIGGMT